MSVYTNVNGVNSTPQTEPIPGRVGQRQKRNNAGGYSFTLNEWQRLERFLILGSDGGSYYVSPRKLTIKNAAVVSDLALDNPKRVVDTIIDVSVNNRAPRNDTAIFALAVVAASANKTARKLALEALPQVCRTSTHLFLFLEVSKQFRGLGGRGMRDALSNWYLSMSPSKLAYQTVKYRQRNGWTHRDVLRIAHPKGEGDHARLFSWVTGKDTVLDGDLRIIEGFEKAQAASDPNVLARIVSEYGLPWEAVPTGMLNSKVVVDALFDSMPLGATLRQLPLLTNTGVAQARIAELVERISSPEGLKAARVHPFSVLTASATYSAGRGFRGSNTWTPIARVVNALDDAFYASFGNVVSSNKSTLIGLDVSGSMWMSDLRNSNISAATAAAAMSLVTKAAEADCSVVGFSTRLIDLDSKVDPRRRLDDVVQSLNGMPFGGTDCALPMRHALENNLRVENFVVYTDNETWAGRSGHPVQALNEYRQRTGIPAKLTVVGMTATEFSIADPNDSGMLDVVGFDASAPNVIAEFAK